MAIVPSTLTIKHIFLIIWHRDKFVSILVVPSVVTKLERKDNSQRYARQKDDEDVMKRKMSMRKMAEGALSLSQCYIDMIAAVIRAQS